MRMSSVGRRHAAVNARHDGERAVLLDVGVDAVVDESRVALVFVLIGPECFQQRGQADLAGRIFLAIGQLREDFADGLDAAIADLRNELRFFQRNSRERNSVRSDRSQLRPDRIRAAAPPGSCTNRSPVPALVQAPTFETLWQPPF